MPLEHDLYLVVEQLLVFDVVGMTEHAEVVAPHKYPGAQRRDDGFAQHGRSQRRTAFAVPDRRVDRQSVSLRGRTAGTSLQQPFKVSPSIVRRPHFGVAKSRTLRRRETSWDTVHLIETNDVIRTSGANSPHETLVTLVDSNDRPIII